LALTNPSPPISLFLLHLLNNSETTKKATAPEIAPITAAFVSNSNPGSSYCLVIGVGKNIFASLSMSAGWFRSDLDVTRSTLCSGVSSSMPS